MPLLTETILESRSSLWLSPGHTRLAHLHFHYSKEGEESPTKVVVRVTRLADNKTWSLPSPPATPSTQPVFISSMAWLGEDQLVVSWLDSTQHSLLLTLCSESPGPDWVCQVAGTDGSYYGSQQGQGWIENYGPPLLSEDGASLVTILPTSQGAQGYWPHIVLFRSEK